MQAAIVRAFGAPLVIEAITLEAPQAGEVRVALAACAVCHSDIHYAEGAWGGAMPVVLGHEASGVVEAVGPGVTSVATGDPVIVTLIRHCGQCFYCSAGAPTQCEANFPLDNATRIRDVGGRPVRQGLRTAGFAEATVVHESQCVVMPKDLPFDCAALLACGVITGLGAATNTAKIQVGSNAVVIGTGGVGLNSRQGARLSGAHPIIAVDLSDEKLAAARIFGATHAINPAREDVVAAVKVALEAADFADSGQTVLGSKMGSTRPRVDIPKLIALYQDGRLLLDELITGRYALADINAAFESVKRGAALRNVGVF